MQNTDDHDINWLMNSIEPWSDVVMRWEKTYHLRHNLKDDMTISQYTKKFLGLKTKLGYTLLVRKRFPEKDMQLFSQNFELFSAKIIEYGKTLKRAKVIEHLKLSNEDISKDLHTINLLMLLSLLVKPIIVKKMKGSGSWKPSSTEISEGFIIHMPRFLSNLGFPDTITVGSEEFEIFSDNSLIGTGIILNNFICKYSCKWVTVGSSKYKLKSVILVDVSNFMLPVLGVIENIIISDSRQVSFIYNEVEVKMFNEHIYAFQIVETCKIKFVTFPEIFQFTLVLLNKSADGKLYISMKTNQ
ncbi:hypothetical protein FQA39_LY11061 [Lamprigera yunnana]|nr:hypothetical protein FQA39_LY11061 [Lamprigera yunnana]